MQILYIDNRNEQIHIGKILKDFSEEMIKIKMMNLKYSTKSWKFISLTHFSKSDHSSDIIS